MKCAGAARRASRDVGSAAQFEFAGASAARAGFVSAEGLAASLDASLPALSAGLSAAGLLSCFSALSVFAAGFEPLPLKSVAYQPVPFSWNPAAVTILASADLPHSGHLVSGLSLTRCRNSFWNPHLPQRYS